jgi:hypothetical protein
MDKAISSASAPISKARTGFGDQVARMGADNARANDTPGSLFAKHFGHAFTASHAQ